jgi:oligopeptide/dipeptide ABC transporter ATP-binding protein
MSAALLEVRDLRTCVMRDGVELAIVDGVSFDLARGEILALVGESGSGKTMTALSILGLLPSGVCIAGGAIRFDGLDLARASAGELRSVRGGGIAMVFQDALSALNPLLTIGEQVIEVVRLHARMSGARARARARELLAQCGLPEPDAALAAFPHQLSGGMRQRAQLAMALGGEPRVLIADEPTSALDASLARDMLALLEKLARERELALLLVTHDFGAVENLAQRVAVMYAGRIVESGAARDVLRRPQHPYTRALLASLPSRARRGEDLHAIPGQPPELHERPSGCAFRTRCSIAREACALEVPALNASITLDGGRRLVACPFHTAAIDVEAAP